jgi:hypothetical protein
MAVIIDATAQSLTSDNDNGKNSAIQESSKGRHIHEHPFMKEVNFYLSCISISLSISFSLLQVV